MCQGKEHLYMHVPFMMQRGLTGATVCVSSVCACPPKVGHVRKGRVASQRFTDIPAIQNQDMSCCGAIGSMST